MAQHRPHQKATGRHGAAFLVFTLDAAGERARRRLLPRRLGSWELALYRDCLDTALAAGRANGCDLRVCAPQRLQLPADVEQFAQQGRGFGDRLRRAIDRLRPSTEQPLVVVGSDAPDLEPRHVADALERLAERPDRLVLGPSPDGGFYLLAAARPLDELLAEVAWLRSDTLASLLAAARARGIEVALLGPLADLDRAADLDGWLAHRKAPASPWLRGLVALLRRLRRPRPASILGRPLPGRLAAVTARGPPR
jgi:2-phospho-L-lactate guanylyltransferase (CobY/MobA/RfbA family)